MESTLSHRHLQSITTEKGTYRINNNRDNVQRHKKRPLSYFSHLANTPSERLLAAIVIVLFSLMCLSFVWAYYLFSSGCVASFFPFTRPSFLRPDPVSSPTYDSPPQVVELDRGISTPPYDSSERYLSYLPHSGFHNQRIALENALVMARILNRTLLVPPVRLGNGILTYYPFDHLYELVTLQGKDRLEHCTNTSSWKALPIECSDYYDYTLVPWNWLTNISTLPESHKLLNRWNMSDAWLSSELGMTPDDVFSVKDHTAYQFRFVDADPLDMPSSRFQEVISIALLEQLPHRLLQLGTLFGSSRLRLREQENIHFRTDVREAMVFSNPILLRLADSIKAKLGGAYLAAHIRVGDGQFERKAKKNVRLSFWRLLHDELDLSESAILELESRITNSSVSSPPPLLHDPNIFHAPQAAASALPGSSSIRPQLPCRRPLHASSHLSKLNLPLFISTDSPPTQPHLSLFTQAFPCTFFLSDFPDELAELCKLRSGYDGLMMEPFIVSFLDAIIAGKAGRVVGTEGSTFSQFVLDVLWRRYHGWDIVQRG